LLLRLRFTDDLLLPVPLRPDAEAEAPAPESMALTPASKEVDEEKEEEEEVEEEEEEEARRPEIADEELAFEAEAAETEVAEAFLLLLEFLALPAPLVEPPRALLLVVFDEEADADAEDANVPPGLDGVTEELTAEEDAADAAAAAFLRPLVVEPLLLVPLPCEALLLLLLRPRDPFLFTLPAVEPPLLRRFDDEPAPADAVVEVDEASTCMGSENCLCAKEPAAPAEEAREEEEEEEGGSMVEEEAAVWKSDAAEEDMGSSVWPCAGACCC